MTTKSGSASGAKHESGIQAGDSGARFGRGLNHNRVIGLYLAGCLTLAVIAVVLLVSSCGGSKSGSTEVATESSAQPLSETSAVPAVATGPSSEVVTASLSAPAASASPLGLPPEIAIGEMETVVAPGEPISFTVYGTPDVTEMALSDGLNDAQAFVHDPSGDVWRVDYRVPLKPKQERIGLSVTAKNDLGRWRRVWVFLQVASTAQVAKAEAEKPAPAGAEPDSVTGR
jgi:hypothetical protein